jgi:acyl-CoA synthetase (AMP-forming)/AMP-acid ligase II
VRTDDQLGTQHPPPTNGVALFLEQCRRTPERVALVIPRGGAEGLEEVVTYRALATRVAELQAGLARAGLRENDRVLMLFGASVDFFALAIAVIASGMTVVLIDGALGARRALVALTVAKPRAVVGMRAMLKYWAALPQVWRAKRFSVDGELAGVSGLDALVVAGVHDVVVRSRAPADHALITFTSGSTGRPKGVDRTHGLLNAQHVGLGEELPNRDGDVDMTCFPALALHNLASGMTTVLPPMDLRRPANVVPARVLRTMQRWNVTRMNGAPTFLDRVVGEMEKHDLRMPLRLVFSGGAPVTRSLAARIGERFPAADAINVYGSSEAEPMASTPMERIVRDPGDGFLAGHVAPIAEVRLVEGEVQVSGPHVSREYVGNDDATRELKVIEDGRLWHRTGDLARRDDAGRLWLMGRVKDVVAHRGRKVEPFVIEADLGARDDVVASAFVAHDAAPEGELVVELRDGAVREDVAREAKRALAARELDAGVRFMALPMDARHQSKVDRAALRAAIAKGSR